MFRQVIRLTRKRSMWGFREFSAGDLSSSRKVLVLTCNNFSPVQLLRKTASLDLCSRGFAKNRDKKKEKNKRVKFDESQLSEYFEVDKLLDEIGKPLEVFKQELVRHATVRTSTGAIEGLKVHFEGGEYSIEDLAEIGKKNPRVYVLDFSTFPSAVPSAMKALQESELNLNVQQEGNHVIVPVPKVNREHRELLARKSKLYFVKCKDGIRDIQMKYIKIVGQMEKLPSQEKFRITEQLTALGDKQIQEAKELLREKEEYLLQDED